MKNVIIVGGGLAGLVSGFLLAKAGVDVTLIERKSYPNHRVCGEYISNETMPFLKNHGIFPEIFNPPQIQRLLLTSINGKSAELYLSQGGWGISRYLFDEFLFQKAKEAGVKFHLNTEVTSIDFIEDRFVVKTDHKSFSAVIIIGAFGKRSKVDVKMQRRFIQKRSPYVGVKYHIKTDHPQDCIALHNFKNGYCGISNIEDGKTNLCYLTHRDNVKNYKNIRAMEEAVLFQNPFLKKIFNEAHFLFEKPEVINEISFEKKEPVQDHVLMAGDAAGMITPLCGNGMAMAIHSAKMVSELVVSFCTNEISRVELESKYSHEWKSVFANRLWAGRKIQSLFGNVWSSDLAVNIARFAKPIAHFLVKQTHGKPF